MTMVIRIALIFLILTGASGCDQIDKYLSQRVEQEALRNVAASNEEIDQLKSEIRSIRSELTSLKTESAIMQVNIDSLATSAASVSEGGGYGIARTQHGPIAISLDGIDPYLDGYRVTLSFGNPTTATFNGADVEVEWGLPWNTKGRTYDQIRTSRKKKRFSTLKHFQPGSYTLVEVSLTPATPEEVKRLSVGIDFNQISLRRQQPPAQK